MVLIIILLPLRIFFDTYKYPFFKNLSHQGTRILSVMRETQVQSLSQEDPLEKGMATYSNILAWRIPQTEEPGGLQHMGSQKVGHD